MDPNTFPTKGNLIAAKNSLKLATMGYGLMDKKRNILIRELMGLIDEAKGIQSEIDTVFKAAYEALQSANIELGINYVQEIGMSVPVDDTVKIKARSIMGTEIPLVVRSSMNDREGTVVREKTEKQNKNAIRKKSNGHGKLGIFTASHVRN